MNFTLFTIFSVKRSFHALSLVKFSADLAFDDRPIIPLVRFLYRLEAGIEFQFNVD